MRALTDGHHMNLDANRMSDTASFEHARERKDLYDALSPQWTPMAMYISFGQNCIAINIDITYA